MIGEQGLSGVGVALGYVDVEFWRFKNANPDAVLTWSIDWAQGILTFRFDFPETEHNDSEDWHPIRDILTRSGMVYDSLLEHDCYSGTVYQYKGENMTTHVTIGLDVLNDAEFKRVVLAECSRREKSALTFIGAEALKDAVQGLTDCQLRDLFLNECDRREESGLLEFTEDLHIDNSRSLENLWMLIKLARFK